MISLMSQFASPKHSAIKSHEPHPSVMERTTISGSKRSAIRCVSHKKSALETMSVIR